MSTHEPSSSFRFGKNWQRFVQQHFDEQRVEISRKHLLEFLGRDSLNGLSFLDVGCGSGLHSLAALRAGAASVISFDLDEDAVSAARTLKARAGDPGHWQILQGSVLDVGFLDSLPSADVVYSWGVLHHTGDMWRAMDNIAARVASGALLYLALYDYDIYTEPTPEFWMTVKQRYNASGWLHQRGMELWYVWAILLGRNPLRLRTFLKFVKDYRRTRGMSFYTDIVDWLGGWPMDFAKRDDVRAWAQRQGLERLQMRTGEANAEYLFRRPFDT